LQVLGTADRAQIDQRVPHQLHAVVPLLDAFKASQEALALVFPRKGAFDAHPQRRDGFVAQPFAPALGRLTMARMLFDVRNQPRIEDALPISPTTSLSCADQIFPRRIAAFRAQATKGSGVLRPRKPL